MKNIILLRVLLFASIIFLSSCDNKKSKSEIEEKKEAELTSADKVEVKSQEHISSSVDPITKNSEITADTILGRWLRPDGNYVIQINSIDKNNQIDAQYFNPNPIKIARAELIANDNYRIFIEFDDEGYKGSSYDLIYDPLNDALAGKYFQATYGQTYQIGFVRLKE